MKRLQQDVVVEHFGSLRKMLFITGPRQVGKTTLCRQSAVQSSLSVYLSWDKPEDQQRILAGSKAVAEHAGAFELHEIPPLCILDEIHKYGDWKNFLKGLFDTYADSLDILVTGSARLDVFKAGGDSLMGRYFLQRLHPLSVAELTHPNWHKDLYTSPHPIDEEQFAALLQFGGFPEPFLKGETRFWRRWRRMRTQQLLKEDLRDLTRIQELGRVEHLALLLKAHAGQLTAYSTLANAVNASVDSVRRWISTLESLYYCFSIRPWHKNVARALRKEPKYYLWDWSQVEDPGARAENFVASALLKAVHFWTDDGRGEFGLYFVRDKQKREVDFVVVRDGKPWFLVEVKRSSTGRLSKALEHFQAQTQAEHAFQVAMDMPYVERDCFSIRHPIIVPAKTLLSQLV